MIVEIDSEKKEISPREEFAGEYGSFINFLSGAQSAIEIMDKKGEEALNAFVESQFRDLEKKNFSEEEVELFKTTYNLFRIKLGIEPFSMLPESREFLTGKGNNEMMVEMAGPIASGKSTIAKILAVDIGAHTEQEKFSPEDNPFLAESYKDPDVMLRTQIKFFLDNVNVGLRGKFHSGKWVRDTSVWSDIHVFMEWRYRKGIVNRQEYDTYMSMVELFEPLIEKPDLLVMALPDSLENLRQGLDERIAAAPEERKMEKEITDEDLQIVIDSAVAAVDTIRKKGIKVAVIPDINPVELYAKPELQYAAVYGIRSELGILNEYLIKDPKKAAVEVNQFLARPGTSQIVIVHSESMFSGKTSTLNELAKMVGKDNVVAYQPEAALRYGEDHRTNMMDRDNGRLPATTIKSNNLQDIMYDIDEKGITPKDKPVIFIDEPMLFHESSKEEAIKLLESLRKRGFHIVADGIDWQFNNEPFTFIQDLLVKSEDDPNWHQVQLATKCKYCTKAAHGSRRLKEDGSGIAHKNDVAFAAGDNYEPVCCEGHASCEGQETGFVRGHLPIRYQW